MTLRLFLTALATLLLAACAASGPSRGSLESTAAPEAFDVNEYRLGAGDQIRLIVFGEQELSGDFSVDGGGQVSLPLVGEVHAKGLTIGEFRHAVDEALRSGYLKDPKVSAEVVLYRPFYILGEVQRPGTYPYQNDLTVLNAVATAQGFTYRANQRFVFIRRAEEAEERKYPLTSSTPVRPGDTIRISERFF